MSLSDENRPADGREKKTPPPPGFILSAMGGASPLDSLKKSVQTAVEEGKKEAAEAEKKATDEKRAAEEKNTESKKTVGAAQNISHPKKREKTSSLLAKCMPYIYDDHTGSYPEEKPDYTLESVENIIESAEKRASEKIARMYNLKTSDVEHIGVTPAKKTSKAEEPDERPRLRLEESSFKKPLKIGDTGRAKSKKFDTVQIPKVSATLFDDFSARRTDISEGENITTPYSAQGGMDCAEDGRTRRVPDLKPEVDSTRVLEDIVSRTRPVNVEDIYSTSKKSPVKISSASEEADDIKIDDFCGKKDIGRVGSMLKYNLVSAKLRLILTLLFAALAGAMHLPFILDAASPLLITVLSLVTFGLTMMVNFGVFGGFKGAFTKSAKIEFPLALAGTLMTVYFVFSIIMGNYPYEPAILLIFSFLVYDYCAYRKAKTVFANFRVVASRRPKTALRLIDDASTTSAMARSVISGEVLAAGQQETDEIGDFLKNTMGDRPVFGKINVYSGVCIGAALILSLAIGVTLSSFSAALLTAATVFCIGAAPTLFVADMLPFAGISERLAQNRACLCGKLSAQKIEQINAAVVTADELFPKGTIKLYNMTPLSANTLDETIILAAAVTKSISSPLYPMLEGILTSDTILPEADSVKYEENLGISGWVGNEHVMIGNRSLMQAHGVRVPALDVDRKILHKGYFPVYIASNQRACALLVVGYSVDATIEAELGRLGDRGIALLVKNCDPNITEQMLCDYFSLFPDLVKILDHNGTAKYSSKTEKTHTVSAHGFHRGGLLGFLSLINSSFRLRILSTFLYVFHSISAVALWLIFAGACLGGSLTMMSAVVCALCELVCLVISAVTYLLGK